MNKLITARMIRAKGSCYNPTTLKGVDGKTKWTLSEWMNYKHYKNGADDAIWVFAYLADEKTARRFAIWCAKRCETDCKEIKDYITAIEGYYLIGTHTKEQMSAAKSAADRAASYSAAKSAASYSVAYSVAYRAAAYSAADSVASYSVASYSVAYRAAYRAASWAAYSAAYSVAFRPKERKAQLAKIKRLLKD